MGAKIKRRKGKDKGEGREEGLGTFSKGFWVKVKEGRKRMSQKYRGRGSKMKRRKGQGSVRLTGLGIFNKGLQGEG